MLGRMLAVVAGLCLGAAAFSAAQAEPRIALVMGNSNYGKEIGSLPNPVNDATLMARALQQTGFQVVKVTDADWKQMKRAIQEFGDRLTAAGPQATGLFFYAGHGVQVQGMNYLVPVGADISKEADVKIETVSADDVLEQMEFAGSRVNIVILDACRNNPVGRSVRSVSRGLAPMDSVRGTFIAYSTSPGSVAADGAGANSPYTAALAKTIVQPGLGIEEAFRDVRGQVMAATEEKQVPWDSSSLTAPFFFKPAAAQFSTATAAPPLSNIEADKAVWDAIKDSRQPGDYEAYLSQYPNGTFAGLARSRLASLGQGAPREQPSVQPEQPAAPAAKPAALEPPASEPPVSATVSSAPASSSKIELDAKGVDCRINDFTRSESECKNTKKPKKPNKPGH
ncbi:caspase family protein [Dongia sedimenti]|uniref:Caspase family protein n=1 Tax=Dongia sedimenti TaxID=3064282 RepID=A0ABU0YR21_9PROT|nr:caspase family protein [Rhodospirillaceae bacterium R-7]